MDVETDGCDAAEPGVNCPSKMPGRSKIASTIGSHRQRPLARSQFRPGLKSNRGPNADLIIIETEKIDRAEVLAVEIIDTGTPISGDQHVKRRFDKIVVIIPRCVHSPDRAEIIVVLIPSCETEVNTLEQTLLNAKHDGCCREILISKKSGGKHSSSARQRDAKV